jgi:hypothetical protein
VAEEENFARRLVACKHLAYGVALHLKTYLYPTIVGSINTKTINRKQVTCANELRMFQKGMKDMKDMPPAWSPMDKHDQRFTWRTSILLETGIALAGGKSRLSVVAEVSCSDRIGGAKPTNKATATIGYTLLPAPLCIAPVHYGF